MWQSKGLVSAMCQEFIRVCLRVCGRDVRIYTIKTISGTKEENQMRNTNNVIDKE